MPCSTTAVQEAVNFKVTGSNPVGAVTILYGMDKQKLLEILEQNEYDYYVFPHHGLAPDWRNWYWELHEAVHLYLQNDTKH